ncbi:MAG: TSUP family transporter [Hydrogenophaga sp.]|uniref:sulfite exporter TauE/SafE family protein n=1 Tax=unclassified Hydrogenophaga TaxID=2610897 RepID=UPI0010F57453|nr:sulfite exporter TauE/SafE family protein [Hydrogenophaga sp. 2FB]
MAADAVWLLIIPAFVLGGTVKGALGVGLPLVTVPLLSLWLPIPQAIGLMVMPVLLSNLIQSREGAGLRRNVRRFAGMILSQFVMTVLVVKMTLSWSPSQLEFMVALSLLVAVALMAFTPNFEIGPRREAVASVAVGAASGVLGGISSLTGPLVISYLMALKLERDAFIGSISVIYLSGAIPLYAAMLYFGRIGMGDVWLSCLALVPMGVGLLMGRALRKRLNEVLFRKILLLLLVMLAVLLLL